MRPLNHSLAASPSRSLKWREGMSGWMDIKLSRHFSRQNGERRSSDWRIPGDPIDLPQKAAGLIDRSGLKRASAKAKAKVREKDMALRDILEKIRV